MAGKDNKVRFRIGVKNTGDGLASTVCIVNGGAMVEIGFKTELPKEEVVIPEGGAYLSFILKAVDFVERAGALVSLKADVSISDSDSSVLFTCKEGIKVPITKVSADAAEPLLIQDYDKCQVKAMAGKELMEILGNGGYHAANATIANLMHVILAFENGVATVYSASDNSLGVFHCPVQMELAKATDATEPASELTPAEQNSRVIAFIKNYGKNLPSEEQQAFLSKIGPLVANPEGLLELATTLGYKEAESRVIAFIKNYGKNLPSEEQQAFLSKIGPLVANPEGLLELATTLGYKEAEKSTAPASSTNGPIYAALTVSNYQKVMKLFNGCEKLLLLVTPKNIHISGGCCKATFVLTDTNMSIIALEKRFREMSYNTKLVVDRDDFTSALQIMKIGDDKIPAVYKGLKTSLSLKKEGITSRVGIVSSEGEVGDMEGAFNSAKISNALAHLKAGNVLIKYVSANSPLYLSNGDLTEENITGFHYMVGVNMQKKAASDEESEGSTEDTQVTES